MLRAVENSAVIPCHTCKFATVIEAERIEVPTGEREADAVLRCDWRPDGETPRWFAAGGELCDESSDPCDAWQARSSLLAL